MFSIHRKLRLALQKVLNHQNLSSSGFLHTVKKNPQVKFLIPPNWGAGGGGIYPHTPYCYLENPE